MNKLPDNWKEVKLGEIVYFNPKESLTKGKIYKKVSMDCLKPKTREITKYELNKFKGGSKFRNGDTLFARITPCLENGKVSQVSFLDNEEVGFGSTEFIVLRGKENITFNNYIYYLFINDKIKNIAIKSMSGTSGRQRVQEDVLKSTIIKLPPLEEQKRISSILSSLDDKIELNNKMNRILEEMTQTLFKEWFINFNYPNQYGKPYAKNGGEMINSELGKIPKGWKVGTLGDIIKIESGKRPNIYSKFMTSEYNIPIYGASSQIGYTNSILFNEKILITGRVGTHGIVQRINTPCWASDNTLIIRSKFNEYTYQILKRINYKSLNRGTTQPLIVQSDIKKIKIFLNNDKIINIYEDLVSPLWKLWHKNIFENKKLAGIRDSLLPKLMSGEIRV